MVRFQPVHQLGTQRARHDNALTLLDRGAVAQFHVRSVAAIETHHMDDRPAPLAEALDKADHRRQGRHGTADLGRRIGQTEVALGRNGEQRHALALRRKVVTHHVHSFGLRSEK